MPWPTAAARDAILSGAVERRWRPAAGGRAAASGVYLVQMRGAGGATASLVKAGAGTLSLTRAASYSGPTTIDLRAALQRTGVKSANPEAASM